MLDRYEREDIFHTSIMSDRYLYSILKSRRMQESQKTLLHENLPKWPISKSILSIFFYEVMRDKYDIEITIYHSIWRENSMGCECIIEGRINHRMWRGYRCESCIISSRLECVIYELRTVVCLCLFIRSEEKIIRLTELTHECRDKHSSEGFISIARAEYEECIIHTTYLA